MKGLIKISYHKKEEEEEEGTSKADFRIVR
jgi:hypothetical protein